MIEQYVNTGLIALLGAAHGVNLFWFRSWKNHTDERIESLHDKVDTLGERTSRIEGYMNGKSIHGTE